MLGNISYTVHFGSFDGVVDTPSVCIVCHYAVVVNPLGISICVIIFIIIIVVFIVSVVSFGIVSRVIFVINIRRIRIWFRFIFCCGVTASEIFIGP